MIPTVYELYETGGNRSIELSENGKSMVLLVFFRVRFMVSNPDGEWY